MLKFRTYNSTQVLRLQNEDDWIRFRAALNGFAKNISENEAETDVLLEAAETKDKRQQKLGHFFREAYSKAFNRPDMNDKEITSDITTSDEVLQMQLSRIEFADALGMRVNDLFVERMFSCMHTDENDFITFQQFLDVLRKFANGKKLAIQKAAGLIKHDLRTTTFVTINFGNRLN